MYDRYPGNMPNLNTLLDRYPNIKVKEGYEVDSAPDRIVAGNDVDFIHIPSTWEIKTVDEGRYKVTLTLNFPVMAWLIPRAWVEFRFYLVLTSQHDDVSKVAVTIDASRSLQDKPSPTLQVLPTGDPTFHLSSYLAVLIGKLRGALDDGDIRITWDVALHGVPTPEEFGQEVTAFVTASFSQLIAEWGVG